MDWSLKSVITSAPAWCSVDLRDGNQSLVEPMSLHTKLEFFKLLTDIGFKEIEVGFPAASETEYAFLRALIEGGLIPEDVTIQVLTQAREHIIKRTFEAVRGAKNVIVHVYNSTSVAQREQVFGKDREQIKSIAVEGAKLLKELADEAGEAYRFEYSPESFTGTEPEYALEVCNAVLDVWQPVSGRKAIINLPATVENAMPHVYAQQVMHKHLKYRDSVVLSLHPHNDRGCGVAAAETGILAGADRIEGTLFGNGERTGNVDVITLAMNMYSQGVDPGLDFSDMPRITSLYRAYTGMPVSPRQPYAGELVFAAFSGSHQDAIAKGMAYRGLGDEERQIYFLACSAMSDIQLAIKEYIALPRLAQILFARGDIDRAHAYLNQSMRDAVFCGARLRTMEVTEIYPIVSEAYKIKERGNQKVQNLLLLCFTVLILFLLFLAA